METIKFKEVKIYEAHDVGFSYHAVVIGRFAIIGDDLENMQGKRSPRRGAYSPWRGRQILGRLEKD